jgi:hypothetical protein
MRKRNPDMDGEEEEQWFWVPLASFLHAIKVTLGSP